ncbi:MAG: futalosine hydrolase, partial [Proteobacteria bacterium]|nr:futalosine hydrolase [Pseudomonadota bacterium]
PLPDLIQGEPLPWPCAGTEVLLLVCGVGVINAALHLGATLATHPVSRVLNAGLAGSFDLGRVALGATCLVEMEIWPEYGLGLPDRVDPQGLKFPLTEIDGAPVWDRLDLAPDTSAADLDVTLPLPWERAVSLTVSTVTATPERAGHLRKRYGAAIENMEGFALAYACRLRHIPLLEVRTISNLVGSRDPEHWAVTKSFSALGEAMRQLLPQLIQTEPA